MCGYMYPPVLPANGAVLPWAMNNSNLVSTVSDSAHGLWPVYHSGLAVGQPCTAVFSLMFNMGIMPSSFWAATAQYQWFKPEDVTVVVTPRNVKPWAAGSTVSVSLPGGATDPSDPSTLMGIGQVPGAIFQPAGIDNPQAYTNPALTRFGTKTWAVPFPYPMGFNIDPITPIVNGWPSNNWRRWMVFGNTDSFLSVRTDDLLHRCPGAKLTKGGARFYRKFTEMVSQSLPMISSQSVPPNIQLTAVTNTTYQSQGYGFSNKPLGKQSIAGGRGLYPAWFPQANAQYAKTPWAQPLSIPMGDFTVDTNEWSGIYQVRPPGAVQDFAYEVTSGDPVFGSKPMLMCPPMEWDVYFYVNVRFGGKNQSVQNAGLAQC
jgi:hypothetical protein